MRERTFAPAVLAGLAGAALAAVASGKTWVHAGGDAAGVAVRAAVKGSASAPLAIALSLVGLAAWGAVLVLRGRVRQGVAAVGGLAMLGVLVTTLAARGRLSDDAVRAVQGRGASGEQFTTALTGWYWATLVGALLALAAFVVAVLRARRWPAMGSRYDAPGGRAAQERPASEQDLWRALDEGHDPTA